MYQFSKNNLAIILILFIFGSCNEPEENKGDSSDSRSGIIIDIPNEIIVGREFCVSIYSQDSLSNICNAYIKCNTDSIRQVDSSKCEIIGCEEHLYISNDKVNICLTPSQAGDFDFPLFKLMYFKENSTFIKDTSFSYRVIDSHEKK